MRALSSFKVPVFCEEFENGGYTLKTHQIFSLHTTRRNLKTQQSPAIINFCMRKTRSGKSHDFTKTSSFSKSSIFKMFPVHRKTKGPRFPPVWRAFSWWIGVDSRPNRRNKAAFSNFCGVANEDAAQHCTKLMSFYYSLFTPRSRKQETGLFVTVQYGLFQHPIKSSNESSLH